jgi:pimeloyl-ACP methyl ester carboxylesterase
MGTIIALLAYAQAPQLVSRFIFCGGLPEPLPEFKKTLKDRADYVRNFGMNGVGEMAKPVIFSEKSQTRKVGMVAMYCRLLENNDRHAYAESAIALAQASAFDEVRRISVPCLVMTGNEDRYAPPDAVVPFVESIPAETDYHVFPDCGHMLFFEDPEKFNKTIEEFLKE